MWIKSKSTYIGKCGTFLAGQEYDVDGETLSRIAEENKSAGMPAFKYSKITPPWDAKKDMVSERVMELQSMLESESAQCSALSAKLATLTDQMEIARREFVEFEKLKKSEVDKDPRLNAMRRLSSAKYDQATALVELCQMDINEREEGIEKLTKAIDKQQGKTQQTPDDKQYHPGKEDRTK
jgi:chromosome segregation ATPase